MKNITALIKLLTTEEKDEYTGELLAIENYLHIDLESATATDRELVDTIGAVVRELKKVTDIYTDREYTVTEVDDSLNPTIDTREVSAWIMFDTDKRQFTELKRELSKACKELRAKYNLDRDLLDEEITAISSKSTESGKPIIFNVY